MKVIMLVLCILLLAGCASKVMLPSNAIVLKEYDSGWKIIQLENRIYLFVINDWVTGYAITYLGEAE